jgi:hypothetical protein
MDAEILWFGWFRADIIAEYGSALLERPGDDDRRHGDLHRAGHGCWAC